MAHKDSRSKAFEVDTRPTKNVIVSSLTRDASTQACIFDLIDNAIDSATEQLRNEEKTEGSGNRLPKAYSRFRVDLTLDSSRITIKDNCGGVSRVDLKKAALRFGQPTDHPMGIGAYGIGLNRALFRLGRRAEIVTDDGQEQSSVLLDVDDYMATEDDWNLDAIAAPSSGQVGTSIEITSLTLSLLRDLSDASWIAKLNDEISKRYFLFLEKGLSITSNLKKLKPFSVPLRRGGPYLQLEKKYKLENSVEIHLVSGQHADHRFSAERDYSYKKNREITSDFGWCVLCNGRTIIMSDKTHKTGWEKQWHAEFNGFVGYVHFTSIDPLLLPWNTAKTDIDEQNAAYVDALKEMGEMTKTWRKNSYDAKRVRNAGGVLEATLDNVSTGVGERAQGENTETLGSKGNKPAGDGAKIRDKIKIKKDHNSNPFLFPEDIDEKNCSDKLLALIHEAKKIDMRDMPYASLMLLRVVFESAAINYLRRHDKYELLKEFCFHEREKNVKPVSQRLKDDFMPSLQDICSFFGKNPNVLDAGSPYLKRSLNDLISCKPLMNSVAHHPLQPISLHIALGVRDKTVAILRHMVEN